MVRNWLLRILFTRENVFLVVCSNPTDYLDREWDTMCGSFIFIRSRSGKEA